MNLAVRDRMHQKPILQLNFTMAQTRVPKKKRKQRHSQMIQNWRRLSNDPLKDWIRVQDRNQRKDQNI